MDRLILSGIADEAGKDIETQIRAHRELGWNHIELRLVNGKNIAGELSDAEFEEVLRRVEEESMQVTALASRIGNWSRHIKDDFAIDINDLKNSALRMRRLNVKYIRIMSWKGDGVDNKFWFKEAVRRCRELAKMAADADIYLCHENCVGWGGLSAEHMLELSDAVDHPHFLNLYDLGNTISHGYEPWPFFETIRNNFAYVHVKDTLMNPQGGRSQNYTYCGEGDAHIPEILSKIIVEDGYDGIISIEPHVASVVHLSGGDTNPEEMYSSYIKYGNLFKGIINEILWKEEQK